MNKKILASSGILVFCLGISLGFYLLNLQKFAISKNTRPLPQMAAGCDIFLSDVYPTKRVMTENESQSLLIELTNGSGECATTVTINAPNFDISPYDNKQQITLPSYGNGSVIWILTPRKTGVFEIAVDIQHGTQKRIIGISVTNLLGLSAAQAQIISYIGSFLGPMLTAPWWYEKWEERKSKGKKVSKTKQK